MDLLFFFIAVGASIIGGICGIGGGILMKPLIDFLGLADVDVASFLSSCSVFVMSLYNVSRSFLERSHVIEIRTTFPLAVGAALGGLLGNRLFSTICNAISLQTAGIMQSVSLLLLTAVTLVYTVKKSKIHTMQIHEISGCAVIGIVLGCLSSFLGIGGGPFNLAVLHYFFSMGTKAAAANSLFVILLSQSASLARIFLNGAVPAVVPGTVFYMVFGGILGGMIGRKCNKRLQAASVDRLFIGLQIVIVCICIWNTLGFLQEFLKV